MFYEKISLILPPDNALSWLEVIFGRFGIGHVYENSVLLEFFFETGITVAFVDSDLDVHTCVLLYVFPKRISDLDKIAFA